jgi:hypothetical protein
MILMAGSPALYSKIHIPILMTEAGGISGAKKQNGVSKNVTNQNNIRLRRCD